MNKIINHDLTPVTVIGLGNMGVALADAFLKGGTPQPYGTARRIGPMDWLQKALLLLQPLLMR